MFPLSKRESRHRVQDSVTASYASLTRALGDAGSAKQVILNLVWMSKISYLEAAIP